jgi:hypothetical protein
MESATKTEDLDEYLALRVDLPGHQLRESNDYGSLIIGASHGPGYSPGGSAQRRGDWKHPDVLRQGSRVPFGWFSWHIYM